MAQIQSTKNHFVFNKGLNTESNEIGFPDAFSSDERNYELRVDGSRKRRRGLQLEEGGAAKTTVSPVSATQKHSSYKWRSVGGDSNKHFIVHQVGNILYFTDDSDTISNSYNTSYCDLADFLIDPVTYDAEDVANEFCDFSSGRGYLFITNKYTHPLYMAYDADTDVFSCHIVHLSIRDFDGIEDGTAPSFEPTGLTMEDDHRYNLLNAGWKEADITAFKGTTGKWPATNAIWYMGYERTSDTTVGAGAVNPDTGVRSWNSTKMDAEVFGNAPAPKGSLFLNPLDTTYASSSAEAGNGISTWAYITGDPNAGGTVKITTEAAHGFTDGDTVTLYGTVGKYTTYWADVLVDFTALQGSFVISDAAAVATEFTITVPPVWYFVAWGDQYYQLGTLGGGEAVAKSDGEAYSTGPTHVEYHQGHVFYTGFNSVEYSDTIVFSQTATKSHKFGHCHQEQDPTDENFNALHPNDGGHIVIPKLGRVTGTLSRRNVLLVFSDNGVWEIGGGQRGAFTADGYSLRKLTEAECSSPQSPLSFDTGTIFTGHKGIYLITPNQYTGVLEAENISESLVQTLWNSIPEENQDVVKTVYDDALRRVYFLYSNGTCGAGAAANVNGYRFALVLDLRVSAWYKYEFNMSNNACILDAYSVTGSDSSDTGKKVKFEAKTGTSEISSCDFDHDDFVDFDGEESPLPYVLTGWDNTGDMQRRKQAPIITVYSKRTETGYTPDGNGWAPVNDSSTKLSGLWDWSDDAVSGKITPQYETYRDVRGFIPASADDVNGYPVVTTRNKLRGRGRVLQLRFDGAATKDSHILGFSTNYKIERNL